MKITSAHAIAFTALVVAIGGGYAVAHNGDLDKIHFCISSSTGAVRAVDPEKTCDAGENPTDIRIQSVGYHESTPGAKTYKATTKARRVSSHLLVPAAGDSYLFSGKLVVSKRSGTRTGNVTCKLGGPDETPADSARVTLSPGESATLAFENSGKTAGRAGQTAAANISCSSPASAFTISSVRISATPVNLVSEGVPVG